MANRFDQAPQISFRRRPSTYVPQEFIGIPLEYLAGSLDKRQKEFDTATSDAATTKGGFKLDTLPSVTVYGNKLELPDAKYGQILLESYNEKMNEIEERLAKGDHNAIKDVRKLGVQFQKDPRIKALAIRKKQYEDVILPLEKKQFKTEAERFELEEAKYNLFKDPTLTNFGSPTIYDYVDVKARSEDWIKGIEISISNDRTIANGLDVIKDLAGNPTGLAGMTKVQKEEALRGPQKIGKTFDEMLKADDTFNAAMDRQIRGELTRKIVEDQLSGKQKPIEEYEKEFAKIKQERINAHKLGVINKYMTQKYKTNIDISLLPVEIQKSFGFGAGGYQEKPETLATTTQAGGIDLSKYRDRSNIFGWSTEKGENYAEAVADAFNDPNSTENAQLIADAKALVNTNVTLKNSFNNWKIDNPTKTIDDFTNLLSNFVGTAAGNISGLDKYLKLEDAQNILSSHANKGVVQTYDYTINKTEGVENKQSESMNTILQFIPLTDHKNVKAKDVRVNQGLGTPYATIKYLDNDGNELNKVIAGDELTTFGKSLVKSHDKLKESSKPDNGLQIGFVSANTSKSIGNIIPTTTLANVIMNPGLLQGNTVTFTESLTDKTFTVRPTSDNQLLVTFNGKDYNLTKDPTLNMVAGEAALNKNISDFGLSLTELNTKQEQTK